MGRKVKSAFVCVGDVFCTSFYGYVEVISYEGSKSVGVRFKSTGFETKTTVEQLLSGSIKDKLARTVCGVGFIGDGPYKASWMERKPYLVWRSMIQRCYMPSDSQKTYEDCSVVSDWHNFQNFAKWFYENWPNDGLMYELDKDIKVKGNRVYSPDTCTFVTKIENLAENKTPVTLMNGISGEIFTFDSVTSAAKSTGLSAAQVSRIKNSDGTKCTSKGWFLIK